MVTQKLILKFIKHSDEIHRAEVRTSYGIFAGFVGLICNLLLFALKLFAGILSGSLSMTADAFNNLSDASSNIVILVGTKLSSAPADEEHPFGHGRIEYLTAIAVAILIILAGFELASSALDKILHPSEAGAIHILSLLIMGASILVKIWMAVFYKTIGRKIDSESLKASSVDSRNDVIVTSVVLLTSLITYFTGFSVDGYVGMVVALFVMYSGYSIIKDAISPLLGEAPDPSLVKEVKETVMQYDGIIGIHDLMIHSYGPGKLFITLHAEVPADRPMLESHDVIDQAERELKELFHANVTIHMDPMEMDDPQLARLKALTESVLTEIDPRLSLHDFRVVAGESRLNLVFDLVLPYDKKLDVRSLKEEIEARICAQDNSLHTIIETEHSYT